jgi:hypothetical protein
MGARENAALIRRGYAAFSAGDMATLTELFADDIVWNVAGSGGLSGAKQGRDAVFAYFGEVIAREGCRLVEGRSRVQVAPRDPRTVSRTV